MRVTGTNFILGRTRVEGDLQDVRVFTASTGLNHVEIARDARDLTPKVVVVDRRLIGGPWHRVLETRSFTPDITEKISEVRAEVRYESIVNWWGIEPERTWGLPAGMESPWTPPLEMIGNELLIPEGGRYVSGDAPINTAIDDAYTNGRYRTEFHNDRVIIYSGTKLLAEMATDTTYLTWNEGTAGAASFRGGSVFIEPAKPPIFTGRFSLDRQPRFLRRGLYEYGDGFLISSVPIETPNVVGTIAFIDDPYPDRWVPRMFCRAYVELISPAHVPPLTEEEPRRVSVRVQRVRTDFPEITPKAVTPYANKTGVFNAWEIDEPPVLYAPKERPYDIFLPFDTGEDWGGNAVYNPTVYIPATDRFGEPGAAFPSQVGYRMNEIPPQSRATLSYWWKDSAYHVVMRTTWNDIIFKEGYLYVQNAFAPYSDGIAPVEMAPDWVHTKIEWTPTSLFVNDLPALQDKKTWEEAQTNLNGSRATHGDMLGLTEDRWLPDPNIPVTEEQFLEEPVTWITGYPGGRKERPTPDYSESLRTYGRLLYEDF